MKNECHIPHVSAKSWIGDTKGEEELSASIHHQRFLP